MGSGVWSPIPRVNYWCCCIKKNIYMYIYWLVGLLQGVVCSSCGPGMYVVTVIVDKPDCVV